MSINLSGTSAAARVQKRKDRLFSRSMIIAALIILFLAGVFFILHVHNEKIRGDIHAVETKIGLREKNISNSASVDVANILYRIDDAKKHATPNSIELDILKRISDHIVDGVHLEKYGYSVDNNNTSISIELTTTEFVLIAQQMDAFRQSNTFVDLVVGDINSDAEGGEIRFSIDMKRKSVIK